MAPKSIKLYYFNLRGRAETARWMLALAKAEYEDKRCTREEFAEKYKAMTPFGQVPCLDVDGELLCQAAAINFYIAEEFGFMGSSSMEKAQIAMVYGCGGDVLQSLMKVHFHPVEAEKAEMSKEWAGKDLVKFLTFLEKRLEGKQFLVGDKVSLADVATSCFLSELEKNFSAVIEKFAGCSSMMKRVREIPEIAAWIAKRPETDM